MSQFRSALRLHALCCLFFILPTAVAALDVIGYVVDSKGRPITGATVKILGIGSDTSTATGEFRITVPQSMIGSRVTLQLVKEGWVVSSPGPISIIVPANPIDNPVSVRLVKAGPPLTSVDSANVSVDFSVIAEESTDAFSVSYAADKDAQGIHITPKVGYLDLLKAGGPIEPHEYWWTPFKITLPELDIKIVNNSAQTLFFTEADFVVDHSDLDAAPILLLPGPGYEMKMKLVNLGWGKLADPRLSFELIPITDEEIHMTRKALFSREFAKRFDMTLPVNEEDGTIRFDFAPVLASLGVDVASLREQPVDILDEGEETTYVYQTKDGKQYKLSEKELHERINKANGKFVDGKALFAGEISYLDPLDRTRRISIKLFNAVHFGKRPPGAPRYPSFKYSVELDVDGKNYTKKIALSQGLVPQEADRFTIKIAADKSSRHRFRLKLLYNDGKVIESPPISLDLFMPRESNRYLDNEAAVNANR